MDKNTLCGFVMSPGGDNVARAVEQRRLSMAYGALICLFTAIFFHSRPTRS
jgi:hypothetical protein